MIPSCELHAWYSADNARSCGSVAMYKDMDGKEVSVTYACSADQLDGLHLKERYDWPDTVYLGIVKDYLGSVTFMAPGDLDEPFTL